MKKVCSLIMFLHICTWAWSQTGVLSGSISLEDDVAAYATIKVTPGNWTAIANEAGRYTLEGLPAGDYTIAAEYVGYKTVVQNFTMPSNGAGLELPIQFSEPVLSMDAVVVTGTKTFKRKTNSPIIVSVINSESLEQVQACNLSEGLKFQPGLRVETDCQTCNYTQLRMNGLAGGYSQILINGRPIFSPLTGLYGMEQLPVNMIDRIEVVRGGGSSLYGSSAVGGTVNVLTKLPRRNSAEIGYTYSTIQGQSSDHQLLGNATVVNNSKEAGLSLFVNYRDRDFYDHNGDDFSELPHIKNTSVGLNTFWRPTNHQKLEVSLSRLGEYRFGGDMLPQAQAHLSRQAEERDQSVWLGSLDYQINSPDERTSLITYAAWQQTDRTHYTGILPEEPEALATHLAHPPYGDSDVSTYNIGMQLNRRISGLGQQVLTLGAEYVADNVYDHIPAYNYLIDQNTKNFGAFIQSDWELSPGLTLLSGLRMDRHNFVDGLVWSPRASLLYKWGGYTQLRLSYGAGFRAPQAFDADLHIAFAGGGVSRVQLAPGLKSERSHSYSASINYDLPRETYVAGFTLEGFYTRLDDAFELFAAGQDQFGEQFIKRNGQGAHVRGATLELRANYDRKVQLEGGLTVQESQFDRAIAPIDELPSTRDFIRTPNVYGFAMLSFTPSGPLSASLNYVYTGSMLVPHFAGAPNQTFDEILTSSPFSDLGLKLDYQINASTVKYNLFGGIKNVFNSYQDDFDIGRNRDSNYIYGPAQPRTYFLGLRLSY